MTGTVVCSAELLWVFTGNISPRAIKVLLQSKPALCLQQLLVIRRTNSSHLRILEPWICRNERLDNCPNRSRQEILGVLRLYRRRRLLVEVFQSGVLSFVQR